ncbi:hypothetical protein CSHISOI_10813, partial [Colletotrichum shisoi]
MKATLAYIVAAGLLGAAQAAITPVNNIIRHEYNLNARAGVHGNLEREEAGFNADTDILQPVVK